MIRIGTVIVMLVGFLAASAYADVIELKNGQRIEGSLKQADQSTVTVEVGGQLVTFKTEQVRAIYYGSAPSPSTPATNTTGATPNPAGAALTALKALKSVVDGGVSLRDYGPRFTDAKIVADQYLSTPASGDDAIRTQIREALGFYALARDAWGYVITSGHTQAEALRLADVGNDPLLDQCPQFEAIFAKEMGQEFERRNAKAKPKDRVRNRGIARGVTAGAPDLGLPAVWACASDRVAAADKALSKGR